MVEATRRELSAALIEAFPAMPITRVMLDDPTAGWSNYEERTDLVSFEGKTWRDLDPTLLVRHAGLLTFAGADIYRALLPGYLAYLVEYDAYNELPFHVAGQLTRKNDPIDHKIFDRRICGMTDTQRAVIRRVVAYLATREPMEEVMSRALVTWEHLPASATSRTDK